MKPLGIDLFCGLGGFTEGMLSEGYDCIGFDIERHAYSEHQYQAQLVLQDVLTLHGRQFKNAALIVASPPCQFFSYCAMPWTRAKRLAAEVRADAARMDSELALFRACFRIQREACEAAGHHIPMIVENVRGAQKWVGQARAHWGSYYLWGDVPALMPMTKKLKMSGRNMSGDPDKRWGSHNVCPSSDEFAELIGMKNTGGSWFNIGSPRQKETNRNPVHDYVKTVGHANKCDGYSHARHLTNQSESDGFKQAGISGVRDNGKGDRWFQDGAALHGSKSSARKAASAMIARIPFALAKYIARTYRPKADDPQED